MLPHGSARPGALPPVTAEVLGPEQLAEVMVAYRDALVAEQATINRLNVFPVPDGDTGTNMLATLESVVAALAALEGPADMAGIAGVVGRSALMGARGNSGVILCQVLRGLTGELAPLAKAGGAELARALEVASDSARSAVVQPAEGTILTVAAGAARAAVEAARRSVVLLSVLEAARSGALEALWRTPSLLPVLAEAGVVDAGGAGLVLLFDALLAVADGRAMPGLELPADVLSTLAGSAPGVAGSCAGATAGGGLVPALGGSPGSGPSGPGGARGALEGCRYEVMYLLEAPGETIPAFRSVWAGLGDSIVVVGGDGLWSCHIHTDEIGPAIEAALDVGRPRQIRVTDLAEQVEEERWVREGASGAQAEEELPPRVTHVVAVAAGEGMRRIFRSLGVGGLVSGGQSMNPSTAEMLAAIERLPGPEVVVLPNNSNVIPVAEQAARLSEKRVVVVPTRAVQEGFAALIDYDPEAPAEENAVRMAAAAGGVVAGEVTQAVRASSSPAGPVAAGDWIGLAGGEILSVAPDLAAATIGLLEAVLKPGHELVTLFEGAGATAAATRRVSEWIAGDRPGVELERHVGGQPLYPYLVAVE